MPTSNIVDDVPASQSPLLEDSEPKSFTQQTLSDSDLPWETETEPAVEAETVKRHFFKRAVPWWSWFLALVTGVATGATASIRLSLFTELVCMELRPEMSGKFLLLVLAPEFVLPRSAWWTAPVMSSRFCESETIVQETTAGLVTAINITTGILSCLTVGYWMQLSDRFGRVKILLIAALGLIANHVVTILVSIMPEKLPGGYRFLFFGQIIESVLGGRIVLSSLLLAYITDTSPLDVRTVNLVIATGMDLMGNSLGQPFAKFLVGYFVDLLSVHYLAIAIYIFVISFTIFFLPESITKSRLARAKRVYASTYKSSIRESSFHFANQNSSIGNRLGAKLRDYIRSLTETFVVFLPRQPRHGKIGAVSDQLWDWNVFLVGCALLVKSVAGSDGKYLFDYIQKVLKWNLRDLNFWFYTISALRVALLIIFLPFFIRFLRNKIGAKSQSPYSSQADSSSDFLGSLLELDCIIVLASIVIHTISMFSMIFIREPKGFFGLIVFRSLSSGYEAALRSLALSLYSRQVGHDTESGKLLGGLGVVSWISGNLIGPAIFESLHNHTQAYFPQAMMLFSGVLGVAAIMVVLPIRITMEKIEID